MTDAPMEPPAEAAASQPPRTQRRTAARPRTHPWTGPAPRFSPLHERHVASGASFTDFAGWQMPVRYTCDLAEHPAVRTAAGLFDLSHMAEILVVGPQAAEALDYALAGKLSAIEDGQAKYSLLLAATAASSTTWSSTAPDATDSWSSPTPPTARSRRRALRDARRRLRRVVEDESDDIALIAMQGPKAEEILARARRVRPARVAPDAARSTSLEVLPRRSPRDFRGHNVLVARTGYTGEDGFELYLAPDAAPALWDALAETGAGVRAGPRRTRRAATPSGSRRACRSTATSSAPTSFPAQAGLGRVVALDKEATSSAADAGEAVRPSRRPRARRVSSARGQRRAARADYRPCSARAMTCVGEVTSGALSPTLGYPDRDGVRRAPDGARPAPPLDLDVRGTAHPSDRHRPPVLPAKGARDMSRADRAEVHRRARVDRRSTATSPRSASRRYAADKLGDVVYVDLPAVGTVVEAGKRRRRDRVDEVGRRAVRAGRRRDRRGQPRRRRRPDAGQQRPVRRGLADQGGIRRAAEPARLAEYTAFTAES